MKYAAKFFQYVFLTIVSFFSIFPFLWMLISTTNSARDILAGRMTFGTQFLSNMTTLFTKYNMGRILTNSVIVTVSSVVLVLLVSSTAAYGFQMYKSKLKEKVYGFFLLTMMVPFAAMMIPLFQIVVAFNLLNSFLALILVSATSVFMIFFFRQSFVTFPFEIIQAARVDGENEAGIFFKIFLPSMSSTFFAGAIYAFMSSWNAYMWPLIVLQTNEKKTATLMIASMSSAYTPEYGVIMSAIVITTLPTILVFFFFQKQFVQGMLGSVKQ